MDDKYVNITITVPEKFKNELEAVAKERMLSLSSFCRTQLAELLKKLAQDGDSK